MKILVLPHPKFSFWSAPSWFSERLRQEYPNLEVVHLFDASEIEAQVRDAEIIVSWWVNPQLFLTAKKLRWIHSPAAGVDQFMFPELIQSDVVVTNARQVHGAVVAEHVIALIFALAKKLAMSVRFQQQHTWGQEQVWHAQPSLQEVAGATLGLIGLGSIGSEVASRAVALGMRVIATREHSDRPKPENVSEVFPTGQIDSMLGQSDYVVLCPPLTPATRGIINAARLGAMKPSGYLINVGRGPLLEESALIEALRNKKIGGAALDVFATEPLPPDSPLWELDNLVITPHTAGLATRMWERHYSLFTENLRRYLARQPLLAIVDKKLGY